jgi:putative flippase GtrA
VTRQGRLQRLAGEGARYFAASGAAFVLDFALYVGLIRLAGVHYLIAAPLGFGTGLLLVYFLSIRWVFKERRLDDARAEFAVFAGIGLAGMAMNELVIYAGVAHFALSFELAKLASASVVFFINFSLRKLLLFTRY